MVIDKKKAAGRFDPKNAARRQVNFFSYAEYVIMKLSRKLLLVHHCLPFRSHADFVVK